MTVPEVEGLPDISRGRSLDRTKGTFGARVVKSEGFRSSVERLKHLLFTFQEGNPGSSITHVFTDYVDYLERQSSINTREHVKKLENIIKETSQKIDALSSQPSTSKEDVELVIHTAFQKLLDLKLIEADEPKASSTPLKRQRTISQAPEKSPVSSAMAALKETIERTKERGEPVRKALRKHTIQEGRKSPQQQWAALYERAKDLPLDPTMKVILSPRYSQWLIRRLASLVGITPPTPLDARFFQQLDQHMEQASERYQTDLSRQLFATYRHQIHEFPPQIAQILSLSPSLVTIHQLEKALQIKPSEKITVEALHELSRALEMCKSKQIRDQAALFQQIFTLQNQRLVLPQPIASLLSQRPTLELARQLASRAGVPWNDASYADLSETLQKRLQILSREEKVKRQIEKNSSTEQVRHVIAILKHFGYDTARFEHLLTAAEARVDYSLYLSALKTIDPTIREDEDFLAQMSTIIRRQLTDELRRYGLTFPEGTSLEEIQKSLEKTIIEDLKSNEREGKGSFEENLAEYRALQRELAPLQALYQEARTIAVLPKHITSLLACRPSFPRYEFLVEQVAKATNTPLSAQPDAPSLAQVLEGLRTISAKETQKRAEEQRLNAIHDTNRSAVHVQKVCSLLERYGLDVRRLKALPTDSGGVLYEPYLTILKELGFPVDKDKDTYREVAFYVSESLAEKLFTEHLPLSTHPRWETRLEENLRTYVQYQTENVEVKTRFLEIEEKAFVLPKEVVAIMRGKATRKKWEQLVAWCHDRTGIALPTSLALENREEILQQIVASIDRCIQSSQLPMPIGRQESGKPLFDAKKLLDALSTARTGEEMRPTLLMLHTIDNESLVQALTHLCTKPPEKIRSFLPLLSDLISNLARGKERTHDEVERIVGELLFLLDSNVDFRAIPKDMEQAYPWVDHQTRELLRTHQKAYEAEVTDPSLQRICPEVDLRASRLPLAIAQVLFTDDGYCNTGLFTLVRDLFLPKRAERSAAEEHTARQLGHVRSSMALKEKLSLIDAPPVTSPGYALVRICLGKPITSVVTAADARRACLGALCTFHRQGALGDCFVSSQYEFVADEAPLWLIDDFRELVEQGTVTRFYKENKYSIQGSPWPALFLGIKAFPKMSKEELCSLYEAPFFQRALSELGTVTRDQWRTLVERQSSPFDIRSIFLHLCPNVDSVQRALVAIESFGHNPLQRMWQNAAASMQYVYTPDRVMTKSKAFYSALENTVREIAKKCTPQPKTIKVSPLQNFFTETQICVVAQSSRKISGRTFESLSLFLLSKEGKRLDQRALKRLLTQAFSAACPGTQLDPEGEEALFKAFIEQLKKEKLIEDTTSVLEVGDTLFLPIGGGLTRQDIFEQQLTPTFFLREHAFDVHALLAWTKDIVERGKAPQDTTLIVEEGNHSFRLLPLHKSLITSCERPEVAIAEQVDFANQFKQERKPFGEWARIMKLHRLLPWEFIQGTRPLDGEGTVSQFADLILEELLWRNPSDKEEMKKTLLLRFLFQEAKEKGRVSVLHYADTNWKGIDGSPQHFGLMYNPFEGTWSHLVLDDQDTPSMTDLTSNRLGKLGTPLPAIQDRIFSEASKKRLLFLQQKRQKHLDELQRDFDHLLPWIETAILQASEEELLQFQELLSQDMPALAPRKHLNKRPKSFQEGLSIAYELVLRYQQLLKEVADNPGSYRIIHGALTGTLLTDVERLKKRCEELIDERSFMLYAPSIFDQWKQNEEPPEGFLEQTKIYLHETTKERPVRELSYIRCMGTFATLQQFQSYRGSSWGGVWLDANGTLVSGTIYLRQNTTGVGEFLQHLLEEMKSALSDLSMDRKRSMVSSLEALKNFYPKDAAIQEAVAGWINMLK